MEKENEFEPEEYVKLTDEIHKQLEINSGLLNLLNEFYWAKGMDEVNKLKATAEIALKDHYLFSRKRRK